MAGTDGPRRQTPDAAVAAGAHRDFCLRVLALPGSRIQPVRNPAGDSFHVELPEHLALRWGSRGRPCPALWLAFDTNAAQAASAAAKAESGGAGRPELVLPSSRRFWEIQKLSLESGWLVVLHCPGRRHFPALWLWMDVLADGGPLARAPAAGQAAVWTPLAGDGREPAIHPVSREDVCLPGAEPRRSPVGQAPHALPVRWGPPPGTTKMARPRSRRPVAHSLERATLALASSLIRRSEFQAWLAGLAEGFPDARPRIRLFLNLAALIYLDEGVPWPPPPLLRLAAPSP